jgi:hypothetical protein
MATPTTRLFTYNSGATPSGATQYGNIAVSSSVIDGYTWWAGPDESLGYVIAHQDTNRNVRTERAHGATISTDSVGFWRSPNRTDSSYLTMYNSLFTKNTYTNAYDAATWLNSNGYWTSWNGLAGSLLFNGTSQDLTFSPGFTFGSGAFTLEGWFYNNSSFGSKGIIGSPIISPTGCLNLFFVNNTTITSDKNGGGGQHSYVMASAITSNAWHYFIYNRNADGTTAVYIDGVRSVATEMDIYDYNTPTDTFGRYYGGYWPGYWTNVRITIGSSVYDSTQISQSNPTSGLTSLPNTKYLMLAVDVTTDSSGNQTITNVGGVTQSNSKPF